MYVRMCLLRSGMSLIDMRTAGPAVSEMTWCNAYILLMCVPSNTGHNYIINSAGADEFNEWKYIFSPYRRISLLTLSKFPMSS